MGNAFVMHIVLIAEKLKIAFSAEKMRKYFTSCFAYIVSRSKHPHRIICTLQYVCPKTLQYICKGNFDVIEIKLIFLDLWSLKNNEQRPVSNNFTG